MKKLKKIIRCMAYKQDKLYIAVCLDFSLAAQADTMNEAISKLEVQIQDLVQEAIADPAYATQLLNRPSPLSLWIKYYWLKFITAKNGNTKDVTFFEEGCFA